jgi:hypothetical protein
VADADYDCRPPRVGPTVSEPKANRFLAAQPSYILLQPPQAWRLQPCQTMRCWHSASAHSARMADCATRSHRRRFPHEREKAVQQAFTASICTSRSGTYVEQLDCLAGASAVSEGHHG